MTDPATGVIEERASCGASSVSETADIETASAGYASRFKGSVGAWMLARQSRLILDQLPPAPATVLDVGGGHGQLTAPLVDAGYRVTVQGSAPVCRERIAPLIQAGRIEFVESSILALPFPDRSFDAVVSVRLLPHCLRWPELIAELCRVARQIVVVDYPRQSGLQRRAPFLFRLKKGLEGNTRTWLSFRDEQVAEAFAARGWRRTACVGQFLFPMVLHRALRCRALSAALEKPGCLMGLTGRSGSPVIAVFERA
jgi:SAM-dependent methyltransferase